MTTLAWDGTTLAADTAVSCDGGAKTRYARKLRRFADGSLAGFCGHLTAGVQILDWLEDGDDEIPKISGDATVMVINPAGEIVTYDKRGVPMEIDEPLAALGSGGELALGALLAGATAVRAVEIAIERDPNSGFDVVALTLEVPHADRQA